MEDFWVKKLLEQVRRTCKVTNQEARLEEIQEKVKADGLDWLVLADMRLDDIKANLGVNTKFAELLRKAPRDDRDRLIAGGTVFRCPICVDQFAYQQAATDHLELEHGVSTVKVKQEVVHLEGAALDGLVPPVAVFGPPVPVLVPADGAGVPAPDVHAGGGGGGGREGGGQGGGGGEGDDGKND